MRDVALGAYCNTSTRRTTRRERLSCGAPRAFIEAQSMPSAIDAVVIEVHTTDAEPVQQEQELITVVAVDALPLSQGFRDAKRASGWGLLSCGGLAIVIFIFIAGIASGSDAIITGTGAIVFVLLGTGLPFFCAIYFPAILRALKQHPLSAASIRGPETTLSGLEDLECLVKDLKNAPGPSVPLQYEWTVQGWHWMSTTVTVHNLSGSGPSRSRTGQRSWKVNLPERTIRGHLLCNDHSEPFVPPATKKRLAVFRPRLTIEFTQPFHDLYERRKQEWFKENTSQPGATFTTSERFVVDGMNTKWNRADLCSPTTIDWLGGGVPLSNKSGAVITGTRYHLKGTPTSGADSYDLSEPEWEELGVEERTNYKSISSPLQGAGAPSPLTTALAAMSHSTVAWLGLGHCYMSALKEVYDDVCSYTVKKTCLAVSPPGYTLTNPVGQFFSNKSGLTIRGIRYHLKSTSKHGADSYDLSESEWEELGAEGRSLYEALPITFPTGLDVADANGLEERIGPKPHDRTWRDEYPDAAAENARMINQPLKKKLYEKGGKYGIGAKKQEEPYCTSIDWKQDHGWPREQAIAFELVTNLVSSTPLAEAVRWKETAFAATTHFLLEGLSGALLRGEATTAPLTYMYLSDYGKVESARNVWGLLDEDMHAWQALQNCQEVGMQFLTNGFARAYPVSRERFPESGGRGSGCCFGMAEPRESCEMMDGDIVCFRSAPAGADGIQHTLIPTGGDGCHHLPPLSRITLERIDETGTWEVEWPDANEISGTRRVRMQRRLYTVSVAYPRMAS